MKCRWLEMGIDVHPSMPRVLNVVRMSTTSLNHGAGKKGGAKEEAATFTPRLVRERRQPNPDQSLFLTHTIFAKKAPASPLHKPLVRIRRKKSVDPRLGHAFHR